LVYNASVRSRGSVTGYRSPLLLGIGVLTAALGATRPALAAEPDELAQGIAFFQNFDDEHAAQTFRKLLASSPARGVAAKAHLYLGLIAFNANAPDAADVEFKLALRANPAIELPPQSSPKARLLWGEARNEVTHEVEQPEAQARAPAPSASPPTSPAPAATTTAAEATPAPSHPRPAAIALGVSGLVLGAVAVYGGIQVLDYQGLVSQANASPRTVAGGQLVSAHGAAAFWADAWIPLAVAGGACLVGTAFTW
jgi:hypothetical protein